MACAILFFGSVRDAAGTALLDATPPPEVRDIPALVDWLAAGNARLGVALRAPGVRVAIDQTFASSTARIESAREVAFMSPLSGG